MKWGDLISLEYGKPVKDKDAMNGPVPVYGTNGQIGTSYLEPLCPFPSFIVGRKGAYRGVHYSSVPFSVIDTAFYAVPRSNKINLKWAYYKFLTYDINRMDSGSAIPSTDRYEIYQINVDIPQVEIQDKVVAILDAIVDKITVNEQINQNLEQQVSAIYQAWFEDFIPYGGICPAEWKCAMLCDIVKITSGKRPPMKSSVKTDETDIPLVGAASVMGFTNEANHKERVLITGRVGTHGIVQRFDIPCWASDNTLVISTQFYEFAYQILKRIDYPSLNRGSTQPLITQRDMNKTAILLPDEVTILNYEDVAGSLMAQHDANKRENATLESLRDTLLPRLMSGELDISGLDI